MLEKKTEYGYIRFSRSVIERIVNDAVDSCDGKAEVMNYKGKYKSVMPSSNIVLKETEEGTYITVYIVINFGVSIGEITGRIISIISDNVEKVMGERPAGVSIIVTGVKSHDIARRHIVVSE